jgi:methyl coenzyme M reductase subunit C-like uncharacterized protein (methanogenesis marker protein 7)
MLVGKKSTILTVAIPNDLMEIIKKEAERKKGWILNLNPNACC